MELASTPFFQLGNISKSTGRAIVVREGERGSHGRHGSLQSHGNAADPAAAVGVEKPRVLVRAVSWAPEHVNTREKLIDGAGAGGLGNRASKRLFSMPTAQRSRASQRTRDPRQRGPTSLRFSRSAAPIEEGAALPVAASPRPDVLGSPAGRKSNDPSHFPLCWHPRRAREKPRWSPRPPLRAR